MRHAGALVSRSDCTRCGAPRGPSLASPPVLESSESANHGTVSPGIAADGHAMSAAAAMALHGAQSAVGCQIGPSPTERPDLGSIFEHYPCDEEGYAVAIDPCDAEAIRHAMDRYGVVVAHVLPAADCAAGADEIFADCRVPRDGPPCAWEDEHWPNPGRFLYGWRAECRTAKGPAAMRNRTHPMVHQTFQALFNGERRLWVSADTYGIMRPTSCLAFPTPGGGIEIRDRLDWRWELKMHWDCNPWALQDEISNGHPTMFQGLIALVDCPEETGSFLAVPGCTRYFHYRFPKQPQNVGLKDGVVTGKAYVPDKSVLRSFTQRFSLRAGDLLVWDSRTAHANFANTGQNFRLVQFVQMMPAIEALEARHGYWARQLITEADIEGMGLSLNARRLLALDDWGDEEMENG